LDGCDFDINAYLDQCYCEETKNRFNLGSAKSINYNLDHMHYIQNKDNYFINQDKYLLLLTKIDNLQRSMQSFIIYSLGLIIFVIVLLKCTSIWFSNKILPKKMYRKVNNYDIDTTEIE